MAFIRHSLPTVLLVLALLPRTAQAQLDDQVYTLTSGAPVRGTITAMSPTAVTVDTNAGDRNIEVRQIRKIQFADEQGELRSARDAALRGQLEDALEDLGKINPQDVARDVIQQDIQFYRAYCMGRIALAGGGDKGAAVKAMLDFVTKAPGNYHFFDAAELLGDLAVALESWDNAAKYYGAITRAPWPEYQMKAAVLEARVKVAQQDFAGAQSKYDQVIGMNLDTAEANQQKLYARVGKAGCLAETGGPDQGIKLIETIITDNDPQQDAVLFARAYNALGACYRKSDKPKDALLAYLHVDLLFRRDPDAHAEALYHLSQLWAEVNQSERAVAARTLLKEAYAGSVWAK